MTTLLIDIEKESHIKLCVAEAKWDARLAVLNKICYHVDNEDIKKKYKFLVERHRLTKDPIIAVTWLNGCSVDVRSWDFTVFERTGATKNSDTYNARVAIEKFFTDYPDFDPCKKQ